MSLAYYPGCSLHNSSVEFDAATRKVLKVLGVEFTEVPEWTCCGSTPAHMMDHLLAQALAARNLRQAAQIGNETAGSLPVVLPAREERRARDPQERLVPGGGQRSPR